MNLSILASDCLTPTLPLRLLPGSTWAAWAPVAYLEGSALPWEKPVLVRRLLSLPGGRDGALGCARASGAMGRPCPASGSRAGKGAANKPRLAGKRVAGSEGLNGRERQGYFSGACTLVKVPAPLGALLPLSSGSFPKEPSLGPKQGQSQTSAPTACVVPVMGTPQRPALEGSLRTGLSHTTSARPCSYVPVGTMKIRCSGGRRLLS